MLTIHLVDLVVDLIVLGADDGVHGYQSVEFWNMDAPVLQLAVHDVAVDPKLVGVLVLAKFCHVHVSKVVVKVDLVNAEWVFER